MNVLFVAQSHPWPLDGGDRVRNYHILRALAARHTLTLASLHSAGEARPDGSPLADMCARVHWIEAPAGRFRRPFGYWAPWTELARIARSPLPAYVQLSSHACVVAGLRGLRASSRYDAVWGEGADVAEMARRAGFRRVVVDLDDLETVCLARRLRSTPFFRSKPLHYVELVKLYAYERTLARRFWRVIVCNSEDRRFFGADRRRIRVVPNGTAPVPAALRERERPDEILFVGQLGYLPNAEAIRTFHARILPEVARAIPGARFVAVGRGNHPDVRALHDGRSCVIESSVPDLEPYYEAAAIVVVPIRLGSGTRLKVLEALARGKAVVSTSIGAEGLDVRPGVDLEIADDPPAFARACVALLRDPAARRRLGASGRARVLERYGWDRVGRLAERALA